MGTNYVIEVTVSELTVIGTEIAVKIGGTEGYAIKDGDKTYNVFRPESMQGAGKIVQSFIVDFKVEFTGNKKFENILLQASMHGKKIRLTVLEDVLKKCLQESDSNTGDKTAIDIISVSLLQK